MATIKGDINADSVRINDPIIGYVLVGGYVILTGFVLIGYWISHRFEFFRGVKDRFTGKKIITTSAADKIKEDKKCKNSS